MASSSSTSSQQHVGLFGQASKFVSSMLGNGKKPKTEPVKSIALAAAAAKKVSSIQPCRGYVIERLYSNRKRLIRKLHVSERWRPGVSLRCNERLKRRRPVLQNKNVNRRRTQIGVSGSVRRIRINGPLRV